MNLINLINKENNYEVDIVALRKIESAIKKLKGRYFNQSTKRWVIPQDQKDAFVDAVKQFSQVEFKDDREERTASLKIVKENGKMYISVAAFPKINKGLDPLFGYFKTVPGRHYDGLGKKWSFDLKNEGMVMDGIKNVETCNNLIFLINSD